MSGHLFRLAQDSSTDLKESWRIMAPEDEMPDRIRDREERGGTDFLAVRRMFSKQSISVHQPVLGRLLDAGLVEVDGKGRLLVADMA